MGCFSDQRSRFFLRKNGKEFEKHWKIVRQIAHIHFEPVGAIKLDESNHRGSAFAAFAMNMFVEVKRDAARSIEQVDIGGLRLIEVADHNMFRQLGERNYDSIRKESFAAYDLDAMTGLRLELLFRI